MNTYNIATSRKANEGGSVLVVCIGVLAILALMATAFVTTMQMQKNVGANIKYSVHAEMAAKTGMMHAISEFVDLYANNDYTALSSASPGYWYNHFSGSDATDLLAHLSLDKPYQFETDELYTGHAKRVSFSLPAGSGANFTGDENLSFDYAVSVLDLSGRLPANLYESDATWRKRFASISSYGTPISNIPETINAAQTLAAATDLYSWKKSYHLADNSGTKITDYYDKYWYGVSPWGATAAECLGTGHSTETSALNINTMFYYLRNAMLLYSWNTLADTTDNDLGIDYFNTTSSLSTYGKDYGYDDSATFNDLTGLPITGSNGDDFRSDIAHAFRMALKTYAIGETDYPCPSTNDFISCIEDIYLTRKSTTPAENQNLSIVDQIQKVYDNGSANDDSDVVTQAKEMENALNDFFKNYFNRAPKTYFTRSAPTTTTALGGTNSATTPELFVGPSNFYYAVIEGRCLSGSGKVLAKRKLEFAVEVYQDGSNYDYQILYQRWFTR